MKPMYEEEAMMQIQVLGHQTYLYFDADKENVYDV